VSLPEVIGSNQTPETLACDALVVGAFMGRVGPDLTRSGLDEELHQLVAEALADAGFKGKVGEVAIVPTLGRAAARAVAVAGLGSADEAGPAEVRRTAASAARQLAQREEIATILHRSIDGSAAAGIEGLLLGTYTFDAYKSEHRPSKIRRIVAVSVSQDAFDRALTLANATFLARDLINEPPSMLTPAALADRTREIADASGLSCEVLDEVTLESQGFGGIIGVGRGSEEPPRLIRLHYEPANANGRVAIVGKGVTYDSGGLSLKNATSLETMKTDMSGGAAVIGTMSALPRLKVAVEVFGFIPTVENMPSGSSIKPGDVITHYGGRTTEVLNTDAEGRLILADALALASEQQPQIIVDIATLTGSIVIALGKKMAGMFTNDDALREEIAAAAAKSGELFWSMPLFPGYKSELESDIADSKNVGGRYGGAILAALFLQEFVGKEISWAHLDIAGTARADSAYDDVPKGGTGAATRTLINWLEGRSH
jgi:leucyl aminopeptidase